VLIVLFIFYFSKKNPFISFVVVEKEEKHKRRKARETKGCTQHMKGKHERMKNP